MRKETGNVGDLIAVSLCMLAMTVLLTNYMDCVRLVQQKMEVGQIARKYILRMETFGFLSDADRLKLCVELDDAGVEDVQLAGTTTWQVSYGEEIILQIRGELRNGYEFTEKKVSTAKY